jgi:hypothetical protein
VEQREGSHIRSAHAGRSILLNNAMELMVKMYFFFSFSKMQSTFRLYIYTFLTLFLGVCTYCRHYKTKKWRKKEVNYKCCSVIGIFRSMDERHCWRTRIVVHLNLLELFMMSVLMQDVSCRRWTVRHLICTRK